MADMFSMADSCKLLRNRNIYFFGDSNMRAAYKDLLWLLNEGTLISDTDLQKKLETTFMSDKLVSSSRLHSGRDFTEVRVYIKNSTYVEFNFITRCWDRRIEEVLNNIEQSKMPTPDIIIFNSCVWDISRWGPNGISEYKDNLVKLCCRLRNVLPSKCVVMWTTTLPVSPSCKAAFLVEQVDFLKHSLHFDIMEANLFARDVIVKHGFDILDLHHHLRMQTLLHKKDGLHWQPMAVRLQTNLILTHIALSLGCKLPGNITSAVLDTYKEMDQIQLPVQPKSIDLVLPSSLKQYAEEFGITANAQNCRNRKRGGKKIKLRRGPYYSARRRLSGRYEEDHLPFEDDFILEQFGDNFHNAQARGPIRNRNRWNVM